MQKTTIARKIEFATSRLVGWSPILFPIIGSLCILGWLINFSRSGFDFTDESYYLVWMADPFLYDSSSTQFGFIYHPLYRLLGGNIAALRQANIVITFCLSWILFQTLLRVIFIGAAQDRWQRFALASGFASASLIAFSAWLTTPNYNSLALQSLMITATGLLLAESTASRSSVLGWVLIGTGGWLAFMAKPSTAAALGGCTGIYLFSAGKLRGKLFLISLGVASALCVLSALALDGSILGFVGRLQRGFGLGKTLGGGHTVEEIMRLDTFQLNRLQRALLAGFTFLSFSGAYSICSDRKPLKMAAAAVTAILFLFVTLTTFGVFHNRIELGRFPQLLLVAIPFSAAAFGIFSQREKILSKTPLAHWALAIMFIAFPHIYAFGTNDNYWHVGGFASLFWLLSGLVIVGSVVRDQKNLILLLPLVLGTQTISVVLIQNGMESPYRNDQALRLNDHPVDIGSSTLILSRGYATYLASSIGGARQVGFRAGTPVIDLTGQSPGILYALGAKGLGQAWLIGGYSGSLSFTMEALRRVPCDQIADAWLLAEPDGPRSIPAEVLSRFGADLSRDYTTVASWETAEGAGGYEERRTQHLMKPNRSQKEALRLCESSRL